MGTSRNTSRARRIACAAAVLLAAGWCACTAAAAAPPVASAARAPSVADQVCAIAGTAEAPGARRLVRLVQRRHIEVLSDEVAAPLEEYWCAAKLYLLQPILRRVTTTKPSLTKRLGPFAFDLHVELVAPGAGADQVRAVWSEFNLRGAARRTIYRRVGSSRWVRADGPDAVVPHGSFVQYAVRLGDGRGRSPWIYSRQFTF